MDNFNIANSVVEKIGNTPLIRLNRLGENLYCDLIAKIESFNPLHSVKDRIGMAMIEDSEKRGILKKGMTIIEPTSGNTGIAIAFISAVKGYKCILVMPETMSIERRKIMKIFGAEIILTSGKYGMKGAIEKAETLLKKNKNFVMLQQFKNVANPEIHEKTTAMEIWNDTNGKIDIFVAGVGTGGTITGVGTFLKKMKPNVRIIAVEPSSSPVLSGGNPASHKIQGIGAGFIPDVLDKKVIDEIITVDDENAKETSIKLAQKEGILAGISSGAALYAAIKIASYEKNKNKMIVVLLPDTGERYLSSYLFEGI